jgi:folate-binding protein YgfZ
MAECWFARLPDRGVLSVGGADARPFLQGLLSNDVDRLSPERAVYAALLTPQGKYLFDLILVDRGDAIWLDVEAARRAELLQRLTMYRLRARVVLADVSDDLAVVAIGTPGVPFDLREPGSCAPLDGGVVLADPRLVALGQRAILPRHAAASTLAALGLVERDSERYERLRLELGVPAPPHDLVVQRSLLLESNFEELHGVSFSKGCYVGQELTARTKHRALVRKRLLPVRIEGPLPPPGTPLLLDGREAGEMRSGQGDRGIALLRLEALGDGTPTLTAGGSRVTPVWPAWLPRVAGEVVAR